MSFWDIKGAIQCTGCSNFYHGKCVGVDLRGFHMKKSWRCDSCVPNVVGEVMESTTESGRARKRSRNDDGEYVDIGEVMRTLKAILQQNQELNQKVEQLIEENNQR